MQKPMDDRVLLSRYPVCQSLLGDFKRRGAGGVLFIETGRLLPVGEPVTVLIEFPKEKYFFRLRGQVIARRRGSREPRLVPGVEVEFGQAESHTLQVVLDCAEGKTVDFVPRRSRRLACSFVVDYRSDNGFIREFAEDISEGGTFIRTDTFFPVGTPVEVKLKPPGYLLGVKLRGRVAWRKDSGEPRGMGIEFIFGSERQRRKLAELVARLVALAGRKVRQRVRALRTGKK